MEYEKDLEILNEAAIKLLASQSLETLCVTIVEEAKKLVTAAHGSIFLHHDSTLERIYSSSPLLYKAKVRKKGVTEKAFKSGKFTIIQGKKLELLNPQVKQLGVITLVMIPLSYRDESIGILSMYFKNEEYFTDRELHILKLFATMASLAITRTRHHEDTIRALEIRDRFIALASHELRTPLTSINGYIQLLHSKLADKNTVESRWIKELSNESARMTTLVKDLLDVNRVKQGQLALVFSEVSLANILTKTIERFKVQHPDRFIIFKNTTAEKKDVVIGDHEKLLEMISAILENAIKFSKSDSKITITLSYKNRYVSIKINDEGKGIPQQDLDSIFEGFYKTKHSKEKEGMGIGLLLAKHVITLHKGKIHITSEENKGTAVQIDLPAAKI